MQLFQHTVSKLFEEMDKHKKGYWFCCYWLLYIISFDNVKHLCERTVCVRMLLYMAYICENIRVQTVFASCYQCSLAGYFVFRATYSKMARNCVSAICWRNRLLCQGYVNHACKIETGSSRQTSSWDRSVGVRGSHILDDACCITMKSKQRHIAFLVPVF